METDKDLALSRNRLAKRESKAMKRLILKETRKPTLLAKTLMLTPRPK